MKLLVNGLSTAVRRWPWVVVILTVAASIAFGGLSQNFTPQQENNEAFAPDAPELAAAERISDLFGEESTTSVMQVIVTAEDGEVFSPDGLTAVNSLTETIMNGALADRLVQDRPDPVVSFLTPVRMASARGAPPPNSDAELHEAFHEGLDTMPPEAAGFVQGMVPTDADLTVPSADQGLMIVFLAAPRPATTMTGSSRPATWPPTRSSPHRCPRDCPPNRSPSSCSSPVTRSSRPRSGGCSVRPA